MSRTEIFSTVFGSHLYGTATPASDTDFKAVELPTRREILLLKDFGTRNEGTKPSGGAFTEKNTPSDVDREIYSLMKFCKLLADGNTVALDMLFATPAIVAGDVAGSCDDKVWTRLWLMRRKFLSRNCAAFVGYCRQQANKYGIKGSRVAAVDTVSALLDELVLADPNARMSDALAEKAEAQDSLGDPRVLFAGIEHVEILDIELKGQEGRSQRFLSVCGRKIPFNVKVVQAHDILRRLQAAYGERARQARDNENVDWKACSHAVRVGHQAVELLTTGHMTLPLPRQTRSLVLAIKQGTLPYDHVASLIERLLDNVEHAAKHSRLPAEPDREWIADFVASAHNEVMMERPQP